MPIYDHQDTLRALPGGAGESGEDVAYKLEADGSSLGTATTDSNGFYTKLLADSATTGQASYVLHPGPYRTEVTVGAYTRKHSSKSTGSAGPLNLAALVQLNRAIGNGLISSPANGLNTGEVTAAGVDRVVAVDTFACVIEGLPAQNQSARTVTISANSSGNPRIDTVVVEMIPAGNATEGRCVLKVVEGTPASSPVAPTLTQSTTAWQLPLADVAVANGASVISTGNLTDRRDFVERSVTAVESDVVQLQADVLALQTPAVPRVALVGYSQTSWNPGALAAGATMTMIVPLTFASGYTSISATTDRITVTHPLIDAKPFYNLAASRYSGTQVLVSVRNLGTGSDTAGTATALVLVERLVTS